MLKCHSEERSRKNPGWMGNCELPSAISSRVYTEHSECAQDDKGIKLSEKWLKTIKALESIQSPQLVVWANVAGRLDNIPRGSMMPR
jgi:hypothetical protein